MYPPTHQNIFHDEDRWWSLTCAALHLPLFVSDVGVTIIFHTLNKGSAAPTTNMTFL